MSLRQLNELLAQALDEMGRQGLTIITKDDAAFKPWLPESYWRQQEIEKVNGMLARQAIRAAEDQYLADNITVADVLEQNIPTLKGNDERMTYWGAMPMKQVGGRIAHPDQLEADPQPAFNFECFQCGRPITSRGRDWVDHMGKSRCDLALLDQETIDSEDYWTDHRPAAKESTVE